MIRHAFMLLVVSLALTSSVNAQVYKLPEGWVEGPPQELASDLLLEAGQVLFSARENGPTAGEILVVLRESDETASEMLEIESEEVLASFDDFHVPGDVIPKGDRDVSLKVEKLGEEARFYEFFGIRANFDEDYPEPHERFVQIGIKRAGEKHFCIAYFQLSLDRGEIYSREELSKKGEKFFEDFFAKAVREPAPGIYQSFYGSGFSAVLEIPEDGWSRDEDDIWSRDGIEVTGEILSENSFEEALRVVREEDYPEDSEYYEIKSDLEFPSPKMAPNRVHLFEVVNNEPDEFDRPREMVFYVHLGETGRYLRQSVILLLTVEGDPAESSEAEFQRAAYRILDGLRTSSTAKGP